MAEEQSEAAEEQSEAVAEVAGGCQEVVGAAGNHYKSDTKLIIDNENLKSIVIPIMLWKLGHT